MVYNQPALASITYTEARIETMRRKNHKPETKKVLDNVKAQRGPRGPERPER